MLLFPAENLSKADRPSIIKNFKLVFNSGSALAALAVMLFICSANQLVNVVFGVWLNDSFGLQIAALGGASAVIGVAELIGEGGVSAITDRISKEKAVMIGIMGNVVASLILPFLGGTVGGAFLGLFVFYLTFEFSIVSMLPMVTGVLPAARGSLMALNIASTNLGRVWVHY